MTSNSEDAADNEYNIHKNEEDLDPVSSSPNNDDELIKPFSFQPNQIKMMKFK